MKINTFRPNKIEMIKGIEKTFKIIPSGHVVTNENTIDDNIDKVWELLNWSCWTKDKPHDVFSDIACCSSGDVILNEDNTNTYYVPLSVGWKKFDSYNEMYEWLKDNWDKPLSMFK